MRKILVMLSLLVVFLFLMGCVSEKVNVTDEEGNLVGEAFRSGNNYQLKTLIKPLTAIKDYDIKAYAVQGTDNRGEFEVNGDHFVLDASVFGKNKHNLASGGVVAVNNTLIQLYADGLRGVKWMLTKACSSEYIFETYYDDIPEVDAKFNVFSTSTKLKPVSQEESFNLNVGETKVLRDGTKIILKDSITQLYAGGLHGVVFELICN